MSGAKKGKFFQWSQREKRSKENEVGSGAEIYSEEHASSIFRQCSNPVCGSWKSQASSPWAKQHRT